MRASFRTIVAVGLVSLATAVPARAAGKRFTTPFLGTASSNEVLLCGVINVDKKPVTATVHLRQLDGSTITLDSTNCDKPIAPGAGCHAVGPTGGLVGYCDVTSSSPKVRVDLLVGDTLNPNRTPVAVPGTLR